MVPIAATIQTIAERVDIHKQLPVFYQRWLPATYARANYQIHPIRGEHE